MFDLVFAAGSRLPLPQGFHLMEIVNPCQPSRSANPTSSAKTSQTLEPIPEEEEAQAQQGTGPEAAVEAVSNRRDDSAALSVGCALLLELGFAHTSASPEPDSISIGDTPLPE